MKRIAQRGLSLDDLNSPGKGSWSMSDINESYKNENQSEDVDLHLGEMEQDADVEAPYSMGDGPLGTMFDDGHEYNIVKGAAHQLYTGWGTTESQELYDFDSQPVQNIMPMDGYFLFQVYDEASGSWIELESMDEPELVGMSDSLNNTLEDFVQPSRGLAASLSSKVEDEVKSMYEDGYMEVDVRQAVLSKYGRDIYNKIFN